MTAEVKLIAVGDAIAAHSSIVLRHGPENNAAGEVIGCSCGATDFPKDGDDMIAGAAAYRRHRAQAILDALAGLAAGPDELQATRVVLREVGRSGDGVIYAAVTAADYLMPDVGPYGINATEAAWELLRQAIPARSDHPSYAELAAAHGQLLDEVEEWRREMKTMGEDLTVALRVPRWDPVAGVHMSAEDNQVVAVIAQSIRDSGYRHGTACPKYLDPAAAACECFWERSSNAMARGVLKAIVQHLAGEESSQPRSWSMPPAIPADVVELVDRLGYVYRRDESGPYWYRADLVPGAYAWPEGELLRLRGPLTERAEGSGAR